MTPETALDSEAPAARDARPEPRLLVDPELMALADHDAIFLHWLPAHRGHEVAADQAANRLPTEQAVLHALITGRWS